jgi:hypothetical protein
MLVKPVCPPGCPTGKDEGAELQIPATADQTAAITGREQAVPVSAYELGLASTMLA